LPDYSRGISLLGTIAVFARIQGGPIFLRLAVGWEKLLAEEEDSFAISVWVKPGYTMKEHFIAANFTNQHEPKTGSDSRISR
jgi:hypothetical protein